MAARTEADVTIYPRTDGRHRGSSLYDDRCLDCVELEGKRFTEPELAAAFMQARWVTSLSFGSKDRRAFRFYQQIRTLERFAARPHASETDYE